VVGHLAFAPIWMFCAGFDVVAEGSYRRHGSRIVRAAVTVYPPP
jgi:hypothetical protein